MKFLDTTGRVEKFQRKYNWGKKKEAAGNGAAEPRSRSRPSGRARRGRAPMEVTKCGCTDASEAGPGSIAF